MGGEEESRWDGEEGVVDGKRRVGGWGRGE